MTRIRLIALLVTACLVCACGGADNETQEEERDGVFEPMTRVLDDAEKVEEQVLQQKQQMDEALRRMEGEEEEPER